MYTRIIEQEPHSDGRNQIGHHPFFTQTAHDIDYDNGRIDAGDKYEAYNILQDIKKYGGKYYCNVPKSTKLFEIFKQHHAMLASINIIFFKC